MGTVNNEVVSINTTKQIVDFIRFCLWKIVQLILIFLDALYNIINEFINIPLKNMLFVWGIVIIFLLIACFIRIFILIKQNKDNNDPVNTMTMRKRVCQMILIAVAIPTILTFTLSIPTIINHTFTPAMAIKEEMMPSRFLLTSFSNISVSENLDEMNILDKIDENIYVQQDGEYIFFPEFKAFFLYIISGLLILSLLIKVFLEVIGRFLIQLVRLFLCFIPLSSMIDPKDRSSNKWIKNITSDALIQSTTLIMFWAILGIMRLDAVASASGIIRILIFSIGMIGIIKLGNRIAKYIKATDLSLKRNIELNMYADQNNVEGCLINSTLFLLTLFLIFLISII